MTKRIKTLFLILILFVSPRLSAQNLSIINYSGNFPAFDTAYDDTTYFVDLFLMNTDSLMPFTDTVDFFIRANQNPPIIATDDSNHTFQPFDTVQIHISTLQFDAVHFDDGDNIVVIWPAARNTPVTVDSISTQIYFQSVIGIEEFLSIPVTIYPNPATDFVYLRGLNEIRVKRVRILDALGKEIYNGIPTSEMLPIGSLSDGTYSIVIENMEGNRRTITVVKN